MILTVTLSEGSLPELEPALARLGVGVRRRPLLRFVERTIPAIASTLISAEFEAIVVTSPRAAKILATTVARLSPSELDGLPVVWTTGAQTLSLLPRSLAACLPYSGSGAGPVADAMIASGIGGPVLYLCSPDRRDELPQRLAALGIEVSELHLYSVELAGTETVRETMQATDLILVASHRVLRVAASLEDRPGLVCLGPATAKTALELEWEPVAVAPEPSAAGVVDAIQSLLLAAPGPQSSPSKPSSGR